MSPLLNRNNIFIIIPAYNEDAVIREVIKNLIHDHYKLVVVDDGSSTKMADLLYNLPVNILRHEINLGQGAALQTGFDFCLLNNADYIVTFDADGQHKKTDIEKLLTPVIAGKADIAFGSRFLKDAGLNIGFLRKLILKTARYVNYLFTGLFLTDAHNGIRAMNRITAEKIKISENGMAHATEILSLVKKNKLRYSEVPVSIEYNHYSIKKGQSGWNAFRILIDLILNKIFK